jgi:hypothetical protein
MNEIIEFNCETNETTKRKYNKEELAQLKTDEELRQSESSLLIEQKALKISAYTKLGLTEEEINAIL